MKTPHIAHLTGEDYEHVYEPAEDSFILLDALEIEVDILRASEPSICVEIGSGSGVVSTFLGHLLAPIKTILLATDINAFACSATSRTGVVNNVEIEMVQCDLLQPYLPRLEKRIDVLMFNPPYVPTSTEEANATQAERDIGGAWAGGEIGMNVTTRVLDLLDYLLAPGGRFYLVAVEQNKPQLIVRDLRDRDFAADIILRRRAGRELLYVIRAVKQ